MAGASVVGLELFASVAAGACVGGSAVGPAGMAIGAEAGEAQLLRIARSIRAKTNTNNL
jgi:hypothetical protein